MSQRQIAVAFALLFAASGARAQDQDQDALLSMDLAELLQLEVTSASWRHSSLRDAAASVSVFRREDLQRLGIRSLQQLLNYVPGMYASRSVASGPEYRIAVRGNAGTAGGALLAIDGQRVNSLHTVRPFGVIQDYPLALVEQVEVIRGPGTARFGGGPSDAVIHVITRRGNNEAAASVGNDGMTSADALWSWRRGDWQVRANLHGLDYDGPRYSGVFDRYGRTDSIGDGQRASTLILAADWRQHGLQAFSHRFENRDYYGLNGSLSPLQLSRSELRWLRYQGESQQSQWSLRWHASVVEQRFAVNAVQQTRERIPGLQNDLMLRGDLKHLAENVGLSAQRERGAHTLTLGGEWQRGRTVDATLSSNHLLAAPFTYFDGEYRSLGQQFVAPGATGRFFALFLEDDWRLSERQRLVLGLRHDDYQYGGTALSPRVSWVWQPTGGHSLKLLYQQAFYAPTLGQLFNINNPVIVGNPMLQPTTVRSMEVVYALESQHSWRSVTLYRRRAEDLIIFVGSAGQPARPINAGQQDSSGIELSSRWWLGSDWHWDINAARLLNDHYQLPTNLAEEPPARFLSKSTASSSLGYRQGRWNALLGAHWRSRESLQARGNPAQWLLNLSYRASANWQWALHVDNVLNADVIDSEFGAGLGVDMFGQVARMLPRPGREWRLELRYTE